MNQIFLLVLATICCTATIAQTTFAPVGAQWHYSNSHIDVAAEAGYYTVESVKDTIVANQECRKLELWCYTKSTDAIPDTFRLPDTYVYNNADTVFYYNDTFQRYLPLYVMNVAVGDSIAYHVPYIPAQGSSTDTTFYMTVEESSSEEIDNQVLRKLYLYTNPTETAQTYWGYDLTPATFIYDRIGSIHGFLHTLATDLGGLNSAVLLCYQDDEISYFNPDNIPCDTIPGYTGINEWEQLYNNISIYPNPVQEDWLQIKINTPATKNLNIKVYSITGVCVLQETYRPNEQAIRINVAGLSSGLYQLQLSQDGEFIGKGRFVKP